MRPPKNQQALMHQRLVTMALKKADLHRVNRAMYALFVENAVEHVAAAAKCDPQVNR